MPDAAAYRRQAEALYDLARRTVDATERLALILKAIECEARAEEAERGQSPPTGQVQQQGTQPPPPLPTSPDRPMQQQQQVEKPDSDK